MKWVLIAVLLVACGDDKIVSPEPVPEPTLSEQLLGVWDFVISQRGEAFNIRYTFRPETYAYVTRHDNKLVWSESGLWTIFPSDDDSNTGILILYSQQVFNSVWKGQVAKERLEIRDEFIWIGGNGGRRVE